MKKFVFLSVLFTLSLFFFLHIFPKMEFFYIFLFLVSKDLCETESESASQRSVSFVNQNSLLLFGKQRGIEKLFKAMKEKIKNKITKIRKKSHPRSK